MPKGERSSNYYPVEMFCFEISCLFLGPDAPDIKPLDMMIFGV